MADGPAVAFCHSPPGEDEDVQEPWFNAVYTCWIVSSGSIVFVVLVHLFGFLLFEPNSYALDQKHH